MPYTRPSRKGLPDPPPEEEAQIPRSESYLHLSDLGDSGDALGDPQNQQDQQMAASEDTGEEKVEREKTFKNKKEKVVNLISVDTTPEFATPKSEMTTPEVHSLKPLV